MNSMNYTTLFFFMIILTIIIIEFNTDYTIINNNLIINKLQKNTNLGTLFIITHNYEHKDIFIAFNYFSKINAQFYMLFADKTWNYLLEPTRPSNIEFIYVKEKTVDKLSSKLLLGKNIIMFLYKESNSSGPFYILKNTKCPLIFLKIKREDHNDNNNNNNNNNSNLIINHYNSSFSDIFMNNFLKKFTLEIKSINYKLISSTNHKPFMTQIKNLLYK